MKVEEVIGGLAKDMVSGVVGSVFNTIRDSALDDAQKEAALDVLDGALTAAAERVRARKFRTLPGDPAPAPVEVDKLEGKPLPDPVPTAPGQP